LSLYPSTVRWTLPYWNTKFNEGRLQFQSCGVLLTGRLTRSGIVLLIKNFRPNFRFVLSP